MGSNKAKAVFLPPKLDAAMKNKVFKKEKKKGY